MRQSNQTDYLVSIRCRPIVSRDQCNLNVVADATFLIRVPRLFSDNGEGIDPQFLPYVFYRLQKADLPRRSSRRPRLISIRRRGSSPTDTRLTRSPI